MLLLLLLVVVISIVVVVVDVVVVVSVWCAYTFLMCVFFIVSALVSAWLTYVSPHVCSLWLRHDVLQWFPSVFLTVSFLFGSVMVSSWFAIWFPCAFHVVFKVCFRSGFLMLSSCLPFNFIMVYLLCSFVVSLWFPCGFLIWFLCMVSL